MQRSVDLNELSDPIELEELSGNVLVLAQQLAC